MTLVNNRASICVVLTRVTVGLKMGRSHNGD